MSDLALKNLKKELEAIGHPMHPFSENSAAFRSIAEHVDALSSRLDKLERDLTTLAGADVPSSEGVDLEGESMTADYNAIRDDADDDRPWREAAEACCKKLCISTDPKISTSAKGNLLCVESAIEQAVAETNQNAIATTYALQETHLADLGKVTKERDGLKEQNEELYSSATKFMVGSEDQREEIDELKAKLADATEHEGMTCVRCMYCQKIIARYKSCGTEEWPNEEAIKHHQTCAKSPFRKERDALREQNERLRAWLKETSGCDHALLTFPMRVIKKKIADRDRLKAEVERLKAAKPKVVRLTRDEIESCWRANLKQKSYTNPTATIDAILALQNKKAAEVEGGAE